MGTILAELRLDDWFVVNEAKSTEELRILPAFTVVSFDLSMTGFLHVLP